MSVITRRVHVKFSARLSSWPWCHRLKIWSAIATDCVRALTCAGACSVGSKASKVWQHNYLKYYRNLKLDKNSPKTSDFLDWMLFHSRIAGSLKHMTRAVCFPLSPWHQYPAVYTEKKMATNRWARQINSHIPFTYIFMPGLQVFLSLHACH